MANTNIGGRMRILAILALVFFPLAASAAEDKTARRAPARPPAPVAAPAKPPLNLLDEARAWRGWGENSRQGLDGKNGLIPSGRFLITPDSRRASSEPSCDFASGSFEYTFQGREDDNESGLMHFRARSYDAMTGRFTSRDPVPDYNLYVFPANDPVNKTDPSGQLSPEREAELTYYAELARELGHKELAGYYEGLIGWEIELERHFPGSTAVSRYSKEFVLGNIQGFEKMIREHAGNAEVHGYNYIDPKRYESEYGAELFKQDQDERLSLATKAAATVMEVALTTMTGGGGDAYTVIKVLTEKDENGETDWKTAALAAIPVLGDLSKIKNAFRIYSKEGILLKEFKNVAEFEQAISKGIVSLGSRRVLALGKEVRGVRSLAHMSEADLRDMVKSGRAGVDAAGNPITLHHMGQRPNAPLVEIPDRFHKFANEVQHPVGSGVGSVINRAEFGEWRKSYWRERAAEELSRRGLK